MTCRHLAAGVVVCGPSDTGLRKRYRRCPVCECATEMVAQYDGWYGTTWMCCRCGDSWCDGELGWRPFHRYWRRDAVQEHRRLWNLATHGPAPSFEEMFGDLEQGDGVPAVGTAEPTGGVL